MMIAPTLLLWACAVTSLLVGLGAEYGAADVEVGADLLRLGYAVAISVWVTTDARKRRRSLPYDYDSFLFYAWPLLCPIYLWQTRRWRAVITLFWFISLLALAAAPDLLRLMPYS